MRAVPRPAPGAHSSYDLDVQKPSLLVRPEGRRQVDRFVSRRPGNVPKTVVDGNVLVVRPPKDS